MTVYKATPLNPHLVKEGLKDGEVVKSLLQSNHLMKTSAEYLYKGMFGQDKEPSLPNIKLKKVQKLNRWDFVNVP